MKLSDLTPDPRNANKGTAKGQKAIVGSIQRSGAGRSIVVDKNNKIIGGNKTAEAIAETFGTDAEVKVIETDGQQLIVHKRLDLDLDDPDPNNPARQLAYADNLSSWASFDLDPDVVMADIEAGFNFENIQISLPDMGELLGGAADAILGKDDPYAEWQGMPEYEQEDKTSYQSIHIHFKNDDEVKEFGELIGQSLTSKTRSIWYSQREQMDDGTERYIRA